jgi:hypothetical protein
MKIFEFFYEISKKYESLMVKPKLDLIKFGNKLLD